MRVLEKVVERAGGTVVLKADSDIVVAGLVAAGDGVGERGRGDSVPTNGRTGEVGVAKPVTDKDSGVEDVKTLVET